MNVTFEKKDDLNGTISVKISTEDYLANYDKRLRDYSKKANIPGFRAGHAPKSMIEKMVGNNLLLEEINTLASKGLFDYIEENKLNVLGQPVMNDDTKIDELNKTAEYTFSFDIGLSPEIELNISAADTFTKYTVEVTPEMIDDEVERMTKRFGNLTDVDVVGENDMVYVGLTELLESGEALEGGVDAESVPIAVNTITNEEIKAKVLAAKKGDTFTVNIFGLFNNDEGEMSHALGVQKQTIGDLSPDFKLELKEIKHTEKAELNQELFDKLYGENTITSEEELREKLKAEILGYFDQQAQHLLEHELFDHLVDKHNITLPDAFLKRWLIDRHADKFNQDNIEEGYVPEANYLKNHILEEKILLSAGIKIDEADIKDAAFAYTKNMFGAYGNQGISDEVMMSIVEPQLKKEDFRSRMINVAARTKVNEYILNTVTIETKAVPTDEFNQIISQHNNKHHHSHE
jgi:trigger factor